MRRATEAEQLLENPLLREAFFALEVDLMNQMRRADLADTEGHTRLVLALQMQHAYARYFQSLINDGFAAGEEIQLAGRRID